MDSKTEVSQIFNNNFQGSGIKGRPKKKTDGGTVYKHIQQNAILQTGNRGAETELIGNSSLRM
jgi:hypothetical protein